MLIEPIGQSEPDLAQIAMDLARLEAKLAQVMQRHPQTSAGMQTAARAKLVRNYLAARRRRDALHPGLFADPAWDMLLDLYAANLERKDVSVSSACIASGGPPTTALRHINRMDRLGLIEWRPDDADGRRRILSLTDAGNACTEPFVRKILLSSSIP